jgi:hypothetical protein
MTRQVVRRIGMRGFIGLALIRGRRDHAHEEEMGNTAAYRGQGVAASR